MALLRMVGGELTEFIVERLKAARLSRRWRGRSGDDRKGGERGEGRECEQADHESYPSPTIRGCSQIRAI